jgi:hypothetical protein
MNHVQDAWRSVSVNRLQQVASQYLTEGWRREVPRVHDVQVNSKAARALLTMDQWCAPSDGLFHLSIPMATMALGQLGVVFSHIDLGLEFKASEVWWRELSFRCRRKVTETRDIPIAFEVRRRLDSAAGTAYFCDTEVGDRQFVGSMSFLLAKP